MENKILTPEEFAITMTKIRSGAIYGGKMYDEENQHIDADWLMCNVLRSLGYGDGVDIFESMPKWYA